jgi:lysophospholipase L1-like esterase
MRKLEKKTFRSFCRTLAVALGLTFAVAGCSGGGTSEVEKLDPQGLNDRTLVVALGDSITFGVLDTNVPNCDDDRRGAGGFCVPLQPLSGKSVLNAGICGEDSYGGVNRTNQTLHRWRPSVILIDYSPNDIANGPEALISNLRLMIDAAFVNRTVPILGTLVPAVGDHEGWNPFIEAVNPLILALCVEKDIECADHNAAFRRDPRFLSSPYALLSEDGLHPNHEGYLVMAQTWADALKKVY